MFKLNKKKEEIVQPPMPPTETITTTSDMPQADAPVPPSATPTPEVPSNVKAYLENYSRSYSGDDFSNTAAVETNNLLFAIFSEIKALRDDLQKMQ